MQPRIMYIEDKSAGVTGPARIGRVTFSKSWQSIHHDGHRFQTLKGRGFKSNYVDVDSGDEFWISGCRKDGDDRLHGGRALVEIDEDAREEYWTEVRGEPQRVGERFA